MGAESGHQLILPAVASEQSIQRFDCKSPVACCIVCDGLDTAIVHLLHKPELDLGHSVGLPLNAERQLTAGIEEMPGLVLPVLRASPLRPVLTACDDPGGRCDHAVRWR